jgi:hypothetical protein
MEELRLNWEPRNQAPLDEIEQRLKCYMKGRNDGVTILNNGTLLFTPLQRDDIGDAKKAMIDARCLIDFDVKRMKKGEYFVDFHKVISVYVGHEEYFSQKEEIYRRVKDLTFPDEHFLNNDQNRAEDDLYIGLYARGKLQYDAYNLSIHKRITCD